MIHRFLQGVLVRVARLVHRFPGPIVIVSLAGTAVALFLTVTRLTVIDSTDNLVSKTSPANRAYLAYTKEFQRGEDFVFRLHSDDVDANRQAAQWLGERLDALAAAEHPEIRNVLYHLDFTRLQSHFLLFLGEDELKQIEQEVGGYAQQLKTTNVRLDVNSMLNQADAMFNDKYLRKKSNWKEFKPFVDRFADMLNQLADQIETGGAKSKAKAKPKAGPGADGTASQAAQDKLQDVTQLMRENEYTGFDHGTTLVVTAQESPGLDSPHPTVVKLRALEAEARTLFPGVEIGLTGEPVLTDDQVQTSSRDSALAGALAFVLIAVLFFVSYRERTRPVIALGVLLMAVSWSLGFTVVSVGHLNIISQAFVAMVIGLGIDFGIQVMGRYEEELAGGADIAAALAAAVGHTGAAVVTGGTTTAVAFFTMCFNEFVGLREFGIVAGSGVVLCIFANLVVLPACYVLMDRRKSPHVLRQKAAASSLPGEKINRALFRFPVPIVIGAAVVTAVLACFIPRVRFDQNLLHLQNKHIESVRTAEALDTPGNSILFGVSLAGDVDEARARIAQFKALPTVADARSPIVDLTPQDAGKKLAVIKRIVASLQGTKLDTDVSDKVDVARARADVAKLLADCQDGVQEAKKFILIPQAREAVEVFGKLIPPLQRAQNAMQGLSQDELGRRLNRYQVDVFGTMKRNLAFLAGQKTDGNVTVDDIPVPLRDRYLSPNGKVLIEISPKENVWEREANEKFVNDLRAVDPGVTGEPVQNYEYIDLLRASYAQAAEYAAIAIVVVILLHFGNPGLVFLTVLPLALAISWTLGLMGLFRYQFNPANVITLPLVIGIGVAYGVYTVDRWREDRSLMLFSGSTGKAIVLSAFTAMIGFGSMMISRYPGLAGLGLLMFLGVGLCLLASIVVLPQLLTGLRGLRKKE